MGFFSISLVVTGLRCRLSKDLAQGHQNLLEVCLISLLKQNLLEQFAASNADEIKCQQRLDVILELTRA